MQGRNQTRCRALHNQWHSALSREAALRCWTPYWIFIVSRTVFSSVSREVSGNRHHAAGPAGLSASARQPGRGPKANALLQANVAGYLRVLVNLSASFSCNSPCLSQRPVAGAHGRPAGHGTKTQKRAASEWPPRSRPTSFPKLSAAPTAPDHRPIRSLALAHNQAGGQARFALDPKHRITRVWGRSLRSRFLGLASASAATGSLSAGALPSPCSAWGRRIAALRSLGRPARVPGWGQSDACQAVRPVFAVSGTFPLQVSCQQWLAAAGARRELQTHFLPAQNLCIQKGEAMPPLLTLKAQSKPHTVKIHLDSNTLERLKRYCEYAHGDISSAVREALIYVFDRDKDFKAFEQQPRQESPNIGQSDATVAPPAAAISQAKTK